MPMRQRQEGQEVLPAGIQAFAALPQAVREQIVVARILGQRMNTPGV